MGEAGLGGEGKYYGRCDRGYLRLGGHCFAGVRGDGAIAS